MRVSSGQAYAIVLAACALGAPIQAQSPVITANGDPSIAADTIYRLARDTSTFSGQRAVRLFQDAVIKLEQDGRARRTYRLIVLILRDEGAKEFQEREFTYEPGRQRFSVNWVRVLKADGEVISGQSAHTQESDLPASLVNPVYVHRRSVRMSLSGVAPGTLVDVSWTSEDLSSYRPGDFHEVWTLSGPTMLMRSRLIVDVPKDLDLRIAEHHLDFSRQESTSGDRKLYNWTTPWGLFAAPPEPFSPPADSNYQLMSVEVASPASWADIGKWYASLAADRLRPDSRLRDTVKSIVAKSTTLEDSIRAIHRWVAQDIRYVALELGIGGYQPRMPDTVMATGFGDCKDKASLFIAALQTIKVDAYPVLLNVMTRPDSSLPTIGAFNHEIAAISRPSGYQYVDLTSDISPLGTLPYPDQNSFALIVHPDGRTEGATIPRDPPDSEVTELHVTAVLTPDGALAGRVEDRFRGLMGFAMRVGMRTPPTPADRATLVHFISAAVFPNAGGDSLVAFDGKDLRAPATVSVKIHDNQATQHAGGSDILSLQDRSARWTALADALKASEPRRMPIEASAIVPFAETDEIRITLPEGWQAHLPPDVTANSAFGTYESRNRQDGRDLIMTVRLRAGAPRVLPRTAEPELVDWVRAVAKDRVSFIAIEHK